MFTLIDTTTGIMLLLLLVLLHYQLHQITDYHNTEQCADEMCSKIEWAADHFGLGLT